MSLGLKELELLEMISRGIDPRTGEVLDTPRDPVLDRKRLSYLSALRKVCRSTSTATRTLSSHVGNDNRGARWLDADIEHLRSLWFSEPLPTLDQLAEELGRTPVAIAARLVKMGLYPSRTDVSEVSDERKAKFTE